MERYNQFRDPATGIAPFIQRIDSRDSPGILNYIYAVLKGCLIVLLLPTLLVSTDLFIRIFLRINSITISFRVARINDFETVNPSRSMQRKGRTILIGNHTSPLDALIIRHLFNAQFTQSFPNTKLVDCRKLLNFIYKSCAGCERSLTPESPVSLISILKNEDDRTLVLFPEGTASNGCGILKFCPSIEDIPKSSKVRLIAIKYNRQRILNPSPNSSFLKYFFRLLSTPSPIRATVIITDLLSETNFDMQFSEKIREALANIAKLRLLDLGVEDKISFAAQLK